MDINAFMYTLPYMVKGMAGIFVVTLVIIGSMVMLNLFCKDKEPPQEN
ncbi:MAG: hypothetical protein VB078_02300 [Clostridiaceae bacterium]|nr:hypothetical protein [Clostridiaceae bacterium]